MDLSTEFISTEITQDASFYKYPLYFYNGYKGGLLSSDPIGCSVQLLVLPSFPGHRSGLVPIHTPAKALAQQGVWSCCLDPVRLTVPSVWTHLLQLRGLRCPSPAAVAAPVAALLTPLLLSSSLLLSLSLLLSPLLFLVVAAFLLWAPWIVDILGSLGMPFRRGRHLIRVSRPIGLPSRHTPGRIRRVGYASWCLVAGSVHKGPTYTTGHAPGCVGSMADQRFSVASPLTGDTRCVRPSGVRKESFYLKRVSLFGFTVGLEFPSWLPLALQDHTWS